MFVFLSSKTVTGFVVLADTTVFTGCREDIERVAREAVTVFVFERAVVFSPRKAASAPGMQNKTDRTKSRIFFISCTILPKS